MSHPLRPLAVLALLCTGAAASCSRQPRRPNSRTVESTQAAPVVAASSDPTSDGVADAAAESSPPFGRGAHVPIQWLEPPWSCDAVADIRTRPCPFAPEGTLVRTSGGTADAGTGTVCERVTVSVGDTLKLAFVQGGGSSPGGPRSAAKSAWQVRCAEGRIEVFWRDALVPLAYENDEFDVDAAWTGKLSLDSRFGARALAEMESMLLAVRGPEMLHGGEALLRVRLSMIEQAMRVQNRDKADLVRKRLGEVSEYPALQPWANDVIARLDSFDEQAPLRVGWVQQLGSLTSEPILPFEDDAPTLFWRAGELCSREEAPEGPSMRCVSPRRMNQGRLEPYVSPFADGWKTAWETRVAAGAFTTTLVAFAPDGARSELGQLRIPTLVARAPGNALAAVSAPDPEANEPVQTIGVDDFDLSATAGSRVTALNYYFETPDRLRSLSKVGTYWNLVPIDSSVGKVACKSIPLVSPELRWAACIGEATSSESGRGFPLVAFEMIRTPGRRR